MCGYPFEKFTKHIVEGTARRALQERAVLTYGSRVGPPIIVPYVVIDVIFDPNIVDDRKVSYWQNDLGVSNISLAHLAPRNAIIAQRVNEGNSSPINSPMLLFPLFAELAMPCGPGEQVWVIFPHNEAKKRDLGYWICRVVGPNFVEDANHVHMPRVYDPSFSPGTRDLAEGTDKPTYEFQPGAVDVIDGERFVNAETLAITSPDERIYEKLMTTTDGGVLRHYEPVPRFRKRPGDVAIEGRNNSLIVLGRHRTGAVASYTEDEALGKVPNIPISDSVDDGAASIDIVVGRGQTETTGGIVVDNSLQKKEIGKGKSELVENEGDPDFSSDAARLLVAQRMPVDTNFQLQALNVEFSIGEIQGQIGEPNISDIETGSSAAVVKADKVRIIARSDIELVVSSYELDPVTGKMVEVTDPARCAAIVIKANGDMVLRPSAKGYLKLGGDDADKALVCTDATAIAVDGQVDAAPIQTTMGGFFAGTKIGGQGMYASKILVVGKKST